MKIRLFFPFVLVLLLVSLTSHAETISGEMEWIPWSGHWWPQQTGELVTGYQGKPSPFNKYDLYTTSLSSGPLTRWGYSPASLVYNASADGWWGQCHAWASAALTENYPFLPSIERGIIFNTGDKKGLITIAHQDDLPTIVYCDAEPLDFHTFMLVYVGEQKLGMCIDTDPGEEVWTYPVYKFSGAVDPFDTHDDVEVTIYYINDNVDPDYLGAKILNKKYTYRLYKDNNGYTHGEWTGSSTTDHPDFCWYPNTFQSSAPLDVSLVRQLAQKSYQGLQTGDTLPTGKSCAMLYYGETKTFYFEVPSDTNSLKLKFVADPQRNESNTFFEYKIYRNNTFVSSGDIYNQTVFKSQDLAGSTLRLDLSYRFKTQPETFPIVCHVYLDLDLPYTVHLPGQQFSLWHGLAISNTSEADTSNTICPIFMSTSGNARVGYGPITLGKGQHWSSLIESLDWIDTNFYDSVGGLKITSEKPIETLRLFGNEGSLSGAFSSRTYPAGITPWVIPQLASTFQTSFTRLFITNTHEETAGGTIRYFSQSGNSFGAYNLTLDGFATGEYSRGSYPGISDVNGWALLDDPQGVFAGTVQYREASDRHDEISFLTSGKEWRVLHPAAISGWSTELTLFNIHDASAEVHLDLLSPQRYEGRHSIVLTPHERRTIILNGSLWGLTDTTVDASSVDISSATDIAGYVTYRHDGGGLLASLPLVSPNEETSNKVLGHVASNEIWWTGIVLYNPTSSPSTVTFRGLNEDGSEIAQTERTVGSFNKHAILVRDIFPQFHENIVTIRINASTPIAGYALFGDLTSPGFSYLSALIM